MPTRDITKRKLLKRVSPAAKEARRESRKAEVPDRPRLAEVPLRCAAQLHLASRLSLGSSAFARFSPCFLAAGLTLFNNFLFVMSRVGMMDAFLMSS